MATEISVLETIGISAKLFKELNLTVQGAKFFLKDEADVGYLIRDFEDDLSDCETVLSTWAGKNVSIQGGDGLCEATRHLQVIDFHGAQLALILKPLATVDGRVLSQLQRVERNLHRNHQVTDEMLPVRAVLIRSHESTQDSTPLAAYQGSLEQTPKGLILRDKVAFVRENSDTISQIINELRRNVQDLHAYPLSTSLADDDCTENAPPLYSSIKIQPSSQPSSSATDVCHKIATTLQDLLDRTAVSPTFSHYERPPNLLFNAFTDSDLESRLEDWAEEIHLSSGTLELMWTDDSTGIYHRVKGYLERIAKELENVQRIIKVYGKQDWIGCSNLEAKSKIVENSHLEIQKLVTRLLDYVPWIKNHPAFETVKNDPFADGSGVFDSGQSALEDSGSDGEESIRGKGEDGMKEEREPSISGFHLPAPNSQFNGPRANETLQHGEPPCTVALPIRKPDLDYEMIQAQSNALRRHETLESESDDTWTEMQTPEASTVSILESEAGHEGGETFSEFSEEEWDLFEESEHMRR